MSRIIGSDTMLHISFSLAAFIFSVVLYILICVLGTGQTHRNLRFRTLTFTIVIGNLISILDNIFRDAGVGNTSPEVRLLLLLLVYLANILLTYYMALYMEGFFEDFRFKKPLFIFNSLLVAFSVIVTAGEYTRQIILYDGEAILTTVPIRVRVLLGYVLELYFLIYAVALFIIFRKSISRRAQKTSVAGFAVVIGGVLFELLNTFGIGSGILYNYFGAVIGLYIFYIGVETPDYLNLLQSMEALDAAKRSADEANRSKSGFLASMSHEIRTPINAVLGMNEMILREAEDDAILTYAENIRSAGQTLLGLINDILDFSKVEAGKVEIIPVDYKLSSMIGDLMNITHTRADEKGLLLKLEADESIPNVLHGDEVRIKQIITNLLTNAVKYTEKGCVTLRIFSEEFPSDPDSICLHVAVIDTGIGIKSEDMSRLFSVFERIDEKRNRKVEGTGLGLSITKTLLELMDSRLEVESTYGEGSTFSFALKQRVVDHSPIGNVQAAYHDKHHLRQKYTGSFCAPEARVLVVDDNPLNLLVFKSLLKQTKIQIDTADSGEQGLELSARAQYDLLFIDHMMPEKDGIETLKELRARTDDPNRTTAAICLTANAISGAKEQYLKQGFDGYLAKPIDTDELEEMLITYLPKDKIHALNPEEERTNRPGADTNSAEKGSGTEERSCEERLLSEYRTSLMNAGIDVDRGIRNNGSAEAYLPVLEMFYEAIEETAGQIDRLYNENDFTQFTVRVHALKSSLRIIGATKLGEEAQLLENAGNEKDFTTIHAHTDEFLRSYNMLSEPLSKIFVKPDDDKAEADAEFLAEGLEEIREAALALDYDRLKAAFDTISEVAIPDDQTAFWDQLQHAFSELDYERILSLIKNAPSES